MTKPKLNKDVEKRFDKKHKVITFLKPQEFEHEVKPEELKSHLADELAREREKIVEMLEASKQYHQAKIKRTKSIRAKGLHTYAIQELEGIMSELSKNKHD